MVKKSGFLPYCWHFSSHTHEFTRFCSCKGKKYGRVKSKRRGGVARDDGLFKRRIHSNKSSKKSDQLAYKNTLIRKEINLEL